MSFMSFEKASSAPLPRKGHFAGEKIASVAGSMVGWGAQGITGHWAQGNEMLGPLVSLFVQGCSCLNSQQKTPDKPHLEPPIQRRLTPPALSPGAR